MFDTGTLTEKGKADLVYAPFSSGDLLNVKYAAKRSRNGIIGKDAPMVRIGDEYYLTDPIPVPCGHCLGCRMDEALRWCVRVSDEFESFPDDQLFFVTLTYSPWKLPVTKEGEPYLRKSDLDDFVMNLRRPSYGKKMDVTFFACGEYGEIGHRPHFHLLLAYPLDDLIPYEFGAYHSATIAKAWRGRGLHQVKMLSDPNMVAYVCGYVEKKQSDPYWHDYPVKPFTSKTKGLGFRKAFQSLNGNVDRKIYGNYGKRHYSSIPRAYLRKFEDALWFETYKENSKVIAKKTQEMNSYVYATRSEENQGNKREILLVKKLDRKRIPKL